MAAQTTFDRSYHASAMRSTRTTLRVGSGSAGARDRAPEAPGEERAQRGGRGHEQPDVTIAAQQSRRLVSGVVLPPLPGTTSSAQAAHGHEREVGQRPGERKE